MLNQQHTDWRASGTQLSHLGGATGTGLVQYYTYMVDICVDDGCYQLT